MLKDSTIFFDTMPRWEGNVEPDWDADTMLADGPMRDKDFSLLFDQPLELDQVDYIKFGDHTIPVSAN